jgi:phage baseplate assembly protein W
MRNIDSISSKKYIYRDFKPKVFEVNKDIQIKGYGDSYDVEAVKNALINIFVIQKYEVPGKPWFGNPLNISVFDLFDSFTNSTIKNAITSEINKFEPRVYIEDIIVNLSMENNRILVKIVYSVFLENIAVQETLFLPFSHNNGTFLGARNVVSI